MQNIISWTQRLLTKLVLLSAIAGGFFLSFDKIKHQTSAMLGEWFAKEKLSPERKTALLALTTAAREHRIPPKLLLAISKIETAGTFSVSIRPRRKNGKTIGTARGLCQFIKSTAKAYRLPWDTNNAYLQAKACARLLIDNSKVLMEKLGRTPKYGEIYLAHVFGAGKAIRIIKAPAKTSVKKTIGARALRANTFLKKQKNARGIRQWAERKIKRSMFAVRVYL